MPVLSGHLFKINLRNYHSAGVPSLGFYNFIFLLQCLYPKAPQFISAAQPWWIINRSREQKDDERQKRSIIHTQAHTFGGGVLLSLFLCLSPCSFTYIWHTMPLEANMPELWKTKTRSHKQNSHSPYRMHARLLYCLSALHFLCFLKWEVGGAGEGWYRTSNTSLSKIPWWHSKLASPFTKTGNGSRAGAEKTKPQLPEV